MFLPEKNIALFLAVGIAIGIVLGGTQALSRSFFSLLIPRGREGEYFALYNAFERGTSWFGVLLFGVMFQVTGSYRPAIVSLIIFFVIGVVLPAPAGPGAGHPRGGQRGAQEPRAGGLVRCRPYCRYVLKFREQCGARYR